MENGANSNFVEEKRNADIGPDREGNEYLSRALQEHFVLKQAVTLWKGLKHFEYSSLIDRVRTLHRSP
jgi:hypothetical protein